MTHNYAEDIARQHEEGRATQRPTRSDTERWAQRIQAILALAEREEDEGRRDALLEQASALQLKFAIADTALRVGERRGAEEIVFKDFCGESNTPLIKAKRILINIIALHHRGRAVMMGEWKDGPKGRKLDRRAKVRVWAHESDLQFITVLYTSLLTQMQRMMATEEAALFGNRKVPQAWRVSYAHGWVERIQARLQEIKERTERAATQGEPGTALVLRDRQGAVHHHVASAIGETKKTRYRINDTDRAARQAGYTAGGLADLGQRGVPDGQRRQLGP